MKKFAALFIAFYLVIFFTGPCFAADTFVNKPVTTVGPDEAAPWAKIECLYDSAPGFTAEEFHPKCVQSHTVLKKAFSGEKPHSSFFLLHYAPGWDAKTDKTPVLLVHGAGSHAFHSWSHPYYMEAPDPKNIDKPGLMQFLASKGYPVFAVTFSHPHGDNFLQAQQLANAITRIKTVRNGGADFKVDIVCHSKGAMATRIYLSDISSLYDKYKWITPFRNDVRKVVFVASPLKGLDTSFRYYAYGLTVLIKDIGAPMAPKSLVYMGGIIDLRDYNQKFPGQDQMLNNWVRDGIGFTSQSYTSDMNLTMHALYNGGDTTLLCSDGIDAAIKKAGSVIETLCEKGIAPSVKAYILAGTKQEIDHVQIGLWKIPVGEMAAASDGVLFLRSAIYKRGLTARGAQVAEVKTLKTHHVGLIVLPEALNFIEGALSGRNSN